MTDTTTDAVAPASSPSTPDPRRWFALVVIAIAQLMVVLDAAIINIALPKASIQLHISQNSWQWAVTAYTLTFGGFLLLGGRVSDFVGRKRAFIIGLAGFALSSLLGGFSVNAEMLFGARALQGAFAALVTPAALALISVTFSDSKERATAFGVYGALSGVGAAIGLLAGGLLTQYVSWRWCLFVNTPMAVLALTLAIPNIRESKVTGHHNYDVPGALTATIGMVSVVFGVSKAATDGWGSNASWPFLVAGALLLTVFIVIESRVKSPLLPLGLLVDRVRGASYLTQFLVGMGLLGMFLWMTFYFQQVHGYSAVRTGLLFLPFSLGIIVAAGVASQLLPRVGPRPLATTGLAMGAGGLFYLSFISPASSYVAGVLPPMLIMSVGLGFAFVCVSSTALFNVPHDDAGAASAVLNMSQYVGGSFGTAIQSTALYSTQAALLLPWALAHHTYLQLHHGKFPPAIYNPAAVHAYDVAFRIGAGFLAVAAVMIGVALNVDRHHLAQHDVVPAVA